MEAQTKAASASRSPQRVLEALSTVAALLDRTINEVEALDAEFQQRLLQAVHDTEVSLQSQAALHLDSEVNALRTRLEGQYRSRLEEISSEWEAERQCLNKELDRTSQAATAWEGERMRLNSEVEQLKNEVAAQKAAIEAAPPKILSASPSNVTAEVERVQGLIKEISAMIEDPSTSLSAVIRKNVERPELESYLRGIQYGSGRTQA